ncbi:tripartite tricarboxylate transporter TctB family protein [Spirochaeta cellobiosiphila]|uniref:tripartite tricarboxylate transporter TctB family protein n=1 Tax=Spirochaeta cellobiosiphila TaxID=504483 RepID=UPI000420886C|nr:tripartite tricarboxylate transporter TctB family protein [Spirochaeta cellobiosiphila]
MKKINIVVGGLFLILGIFVFAMSFTFKQTLISDNYLGAAFFPRLVSVVLSVLSIALIISSAKVYLADSAGENQVAKDIFHLSKLKNPLIIMAFLMVYYFLVRVTGFCITSTLLFTAILFVIGVKKVSYYISAPIFVGVVYFIFRFLFLVQLPTGFVGF